jgi:fatty acid desaturase
MKDHLCANDFKFDMDITNENKVVENQLITTPASFHVLNNSEMLVSKYQLAYILRFVIWLSAFSILLVMPIFLSIWFLPLFSILLGLVVAHGIELQHQAIHYTGFNSKFLNTVVGHLFGIPTLNSYTHYQIVHLWHHQKIGTTEDIEFFSDHKIDVKLKPNDLVRRILSIHKTYLLIFKRMVLTDSFSVSKTITLRNKIDLNHVKIELWMYRLIFVAFFVSTIVNIIPNIVFFNWLLAVAFYHIWHFLFEFPEHYLCPSSEKSILKNTRSISANPLSRYITNSNNFHVEHHLYPNLPMGALASAHLQVSSNIENKSVSYFQFYKSCFWSTR